MLGFPDHEGKKLWTEMSNLWESKKPFDLFVKWELATQTKRLKRCLHAQEPSDSWGLCRFKCKFLTLLLPKWLIREGLHTCTCYHLTFNVSFIFARDASHSLPPTVNICPAIYNRRTIGFKSYFRLSKVIRKLLHYKMLPVKKNKNGITWATKPELRKQKLTSWHWCPHCFRTYLINCI